MVKLMAKKVTMEVIANHLGLSKFVVSKALSGKSGVSPQTRERVIQAAAQLGYFIQRGSQPGSRTSPESSEFGGTSVKPVILVLMPNIRFQSRDSVYWGKILDGISTELNKFGIGMLIVTDFHPDQIANFIQPKGIMGAIGVGYVPTPLLLEIRQYGIPFVLVDHEDPLVPSDSIFTNNMECMARIVQHMAGLGHREMLFVGDPDYANSFKERWIGFRNVAEDHKLPLSEQSLLRLKSTDRYSHQVEIREHLAARKQEGSLPSVLVCANDDIAISSVHALQELNLRVPDDVSVTGFDNIDEAIRVSPNLTTIDVDKEEMGRRTVEAIMRRIRNMDSSFERIMLYGDLVIRESTKVQAQPVGDR